LTTVGVEVVLLVETNGRLRLLSENAVGLAGVIAILLEIVLQVDDPI
jgi:xanthine/uracil permease